MQSGADGVLLLVGNSVSQLVGLDPQLFLALRYDLAYETGDGPTTEVPDGWLRLLDARGVLPTGLVPHAQRLLRKYGVGCDVDDRREAPLEELPLWSPGLKEQARYYQRDLVDSFSRRQRGVIVSPPRSGKTWMGAMVLDANPLRTLWIAPTRAIVTQTVAALREALALDEDDIVPLMGGASIFTKLAALKARVVVATANTAVKLSRKFYDTRDRLVVDEFHHSAAETYHEINRLAENVYERLGLTGTHFRSQKRDEIRMHAMLSDVVGEVDVSTLIREGYLAPADITLIPVEHQRVYLSHTTEAYPSAIVHHETRNGWIAWAARALEYAGHATIVLVGWKEHGDVLASLIPHSVSVNGDDPKAVQAAIRDFNDRKIGVLIGTSVLGEGIDLPAASGLVYAKAGRASVTVTQDYYRVLTALAGKHVAHIVDFADRHCDPLLRQSVARAKLYAQVPEFRIRLWDGPEAFERRVSRGSALDAVTPRG